MKTTGPVFRLLWSLRALSQNCACLSTRDKCLKLHSVGEHLWFLKLKTMMTVITALWRQTRSPAHSLSLKCILITCFDRILFCYYLSPIYAIPVMCNLTSKNGIFGRKVTDMSIFLPRTFRHNCLNFTLEVDRLL